MLKINIPELLLNADPLIPVRDDPAGENAAFYALIEDGAPRYPMIPVDIIFVRYHLIVAVLGPEATALLPEVASMTRSIQNYLSVRLTELEKD